MSRPSTSGVRNSEVERIIATAEVDTTFAGKKARYRGRRSTWPGALALLLLAAGSIAGLTYYGLQLHSDVKTSNNDPEAVAARFGSGTYIDDGTSEGVEADITVTNPASYTDLKCEQPNYISKNNNIYAKFTDGTEVQIDIKGVNWLGMQDKYGVPKGLWDNTLDGSTLYRIGQYLSKQNVNVVRIALSIDSVMRNIDIDKNLINTNSQRALSSVTRYIDLLGLIVQGLGKFNIGVVLDFHVLSYLTSETGLWYGTSIHIADIETAITNLADALCDSKHFNVIGIDLKDSLGTDATWGDDSDTDWAVAATTLGNAVNTACPKWLSFVQGVQGSSHKDTYTGSRSIKYKFYAGSDLTGVATTPINLNTANKLVYAPKYYSSSFLPYEFFFASGTPDGDKLDDFVELDDATLKANVQLHMNYMWNATYDTGAAVVLSSFGGLVNDQDGTADLTSTRIMKYVIEQMKATSNRLAGGFWYNLNPDTYWPYPQPNTSNSTEGGLIDDTWRAANLNVQDLLKDMNTMTAVNTIPCKV